MVDFTSLPLRCRCARGAPRAALFAVVCCLALPAQAQPSAGAARPDPLDAKSAVPALSYESSFRAYRRLGDAKPIPWREANDTVARDGGWRVYLREAQQPDAAPAASPAAKPGPAEAAPPAPAPAGRGSGVKTP